jgi:hypothetical protein
MPQLRGKSGREMEVAIAFNGLVFDVGCLSVTLENFPQKGHQRLLPRLEGHIPIILRRFRPLSTERHTVGHIATSNAW